MTGSPETRDARDDPFPPLDGRPTGTRTFAVAGLVPAAIALCLAAAPAGAQEAGDRGTPVGVWASAGIGSGTEGGAALISLRASRAGHLFSARAAGSFGITEGDSRTDLGLLYGRQLRWGAFRLHGSAGVAWVIHEEEGEEETGEPGLPLAVGVGWAPVPVVGLGLEAFGDLNATAFFGGVVLRAEIGWIR